ncbi:MAG: S1/P1 Nuclease [Caulobacteraceae bacterium]
MLKSTAHVAALAALITVGPVAASGAWAWGAMGHRLIGEAAASAFPSDIPAFLRTPAAIQEIGELAREPDRSKGAGAPHDPDLDPGHFLDLDDQGKVNGGPALANLPATREGFEAALRDAGTDGFKSGYLPYTIQEGYQQLVKDFAYWRVETAALKTTTKPEDRAWIRRDLTLREVLILRDLGYWAHFVGDGSQPLHVSIHYNGWGKFPNPNNYTTDKIHGPFEGPFVHDHVTLAGVQAAMRPYSACTPIATCTAQFLITTGTFVEPLYQLWGTGAFQSADPKAVAFTTERVAAGATELRDLVVDAWNASEDDSVGYPKFSVRDAEAGKPVPLTVFYGDD